MNTTRRTLFLTLAVLIAVAVIAPTAAPPRFSRIVAFGTSLSDPGNAFALTGAQSLPPGYDLDAFLIPSAAYARGGHHFSNGATWIEQFAQGRGLAGTVRPAFASMERNATNFAVGGARARAAGPFNLTVQVGAFLQEYAGQAPSDALYAIEMGSNDIRDAIDVALHGGNPATILQEAVMAIGSNIMELQAAGARHFLIWRCPNVGLAPAIRSLGPQAIAGATAVSEAFNDGLDVLVGQLKSQGTDIVQLDVFEMLNAVTADPAAFGLTTVDVACVQPDVAPFSCQQPAAYLFWDGIHPTAAGHALIAAEAGKLIPR